MQQDHRGTARRLAKPFTVQKHLRLIGNIIGYAYTTDYMAARHAGFR